jgi:hypothetical protein
MLLTTLDLYLGPIHVADAREQPFVAFGQHQPVQVSAVDLAPQHADRLVGPFAVAEQPPVSVRPAAAPQVKGAGVHLAEGVEKVPPVYARSWSVKHVLNLNAQSHCCDRYRRVILTRGRVDL